ncbi:hypothetical protein F3J44_03095 [Pantoea sp. Tr-811]|nr:hypothetical protein [Pantoea sp. Tr-811]
MAVGFMRRNCLAQVGKLPHHPVGAGLPANAAVSPPSHSRASPLPQGDRVAFIRRRRSCTCPGQGFRSGCTCR